MHKLFPSMRPYLQKYCVLLKEDQSTVWDEGSSTWFSLPTSLAATLKVNPSLVSECGLHVTTTHLDLYCVMRV